MLNMLEVRDLRFGVVSLVKLPLDEYVSRKIKKRACFGQDFSIP